VAANRIVVRAGGHFVALDLASGHHHRLAGSARGWCRKVSRYREHAAYRPASGPPLTNYVGQYVLFPCRADRRSLPTPERAPAFVGDIGARVDGLVAWSDPQGIVAVPAAR
jgi:hypothetical protein